MSIQEVYEKYKHLDGLLSNPIDNSSICLTARDLWLAIKESAQQSEHADGLIDNKAVDENVRICSRCGCTSPKDMQNCWACGYILAAKA